MTTYKIQFRSSNFALNYDGEKFREGSFDIENFETIEEAREVIDRENTPGCVLCGLLNSEFVIFKETYDEEADEVEEVEIETVPYFS